MYYLSEIKEQLLKAITLIEEYELRGFTIDRDTALELIRRAYEDLRFHDSDTLIVDESEAHITPTEQSDEPEVEVEIVMSEEGEEAEETEEQEEQEEVAEQEEAVEAEPQEGETDEPEIEVEIIEAVAKPEVVATPEPEVTPEPTVEPTVEAAPESEPAVEKTEPEVGIEATPEPTPEPKPEVVEVTTKAVVTEPSLFGDDDQWTRPTHSRRRLISLYRDETPQEPKPRHRRKSADVEVEPKAEAVPETPAVEKAPTTPTEPAPIPTVETTEPTKVVLADTISTPQTIADTIQQQPSIGQSGAVNSLRGAISVGDRFMLIRELFGGDEAKYESTIDLLDSYDNLDDCIIYIAENFTWRASSDGAKLIMDLLQRKLS